MCADSGLPPVLQVGLGTANLLTHELGLPRRNRRLAQLVERGTVQAFDLGELSLATAEDAPPSPRPIARFQIFPNNTPYQTIPTKKNAAARWMSSSAL